MTTRGKRREPALSDDRMIKDGPPADGRCVRRMRLVACLFLLLVAAVVAPRELSARSPTDGASRFNARTCLILALLPRGAQRIPAGDTHAWIYDRLAGQAGRLSERSVQGGLSTGRDLGLQQGHPADEECGAGQAGRAHRGRGSGQILPRPVRRRGVCAARYPHRHLHRHPRRHDQGPDRHCNPLRAGRLLLSRPAQLRLRQDRSRRMRAALGAEDEACRFRPVRAGQVAPCKIVFWRAS